MPKIFSQVLSLKCVVLISLLSFHGISYAESPHIYVNWAANPAGNDKLSQVGYPSALFGGATYEETDVAITEDVAPQNPPSGFIQLVIVADIAGKSVDLNTLSI